MAKFLQRLGGAVRRFGGTFLRFPVTALLLASCSTALIVYQAVPYEDRVLAALLGGGAAGALYSAAGSVLCERIKAGFLGRLAVSAPAGAVAWIAGYLLFVTDNSNSYHAFWYAALTAVGAMLLFVLPASSGEGRTGGVFMAYVKALFIALFFSGVLFGGLSFIYLAIDRLIVPVSEDFHFYAASVVFGFFAGVFFLSFLPDFGPEEDERTTRAFGCPRFLEILISYIVVPIAAAVTLIYLIYFIRIALTRTWPQGEVAMLMLVYCAAGIAAWYFCLGLRNRFAVWYASLYPYSMAACALLGLCSVLIRVAAYGFTQQRYLALAACVLFILSGVYLAVRRMRAPYIPAVLLAAVVLLAALPAVGANDVALGSQNARLERILTEGGMLSDGTVKPNPDAPEETKREIGRIVRFILAQDAGAKRTKFLPENFTFTDSGKVFGFKVDDYEGYRGPETLFNLDVSMPETLSLDIRGYDRMTELYLDSDKNLSVKREFAPIEVYGKKYLPEIVFAENDIILRLSTGGETVYSLSLSQWKEGLGDRTVRDLTFDHEAGGVKVRVYVRRLYANIDESGGYMSANLLVLIGRTS